MGINDKLKQAMTLAEKIMRGDAFVLGVNDDGMVVIAERAQFACDEAPVTFGKQVAGGVMHKKVDVIGADQPEREPEYRIGIDVADGIVTATCIKNHHDHAAHPMLEQVAVARVPLEDTLHHATPCCGRFAECDKPCTPRGRWQAEQEIAERVVEDDGAMPTQSEIDAVLRAGMCDPTELVGEHVMYETDRREGKAYALPAIVTCVQRSHVWLPLLRGAQEAGKVTDEYRRTGYVFKDRDGYHLRGNPLPVPLEGTVHLIVFTPGEAMMYRELSVPYDPSGTTPRSWRLRDTQPF